MDFSAAKIRRLRVEYLAWLGAVVCLQLMGKREEENDDGRELEVGVGRRTAIRSERE